MQPQVSGGPVPTALFQGVDTFIGCSRDSALTGTHTKKTGGSINSFVTVCTDVSSLFEALNISESVSAGFLHLGGSEMLDFAKSLNMTSTSVAVVVNVARITGTDSYDTIELQSGVTAPVTTTDTQTFFNSYGDSFVSAITLGGNYYAVFLFESTSSAQQTSISGALTASTPVFDASLAGTLNSASSTYDTTMTVSQTMTGVGNVDASLPAPTVDAIVAFDFGSVTLDAEVVVDYEAQGYEIVPGFVNPFSTVAQTRAALAGLASSYGTIAAISQAATAIQTVYTAYGYTSDTAFASNAQQIAADLSTVSNLLADVESNVGATYTMPVLASLSYGIPSLSYYLSPSGPDASSPETAFFDVTPAFISTGTVPSQVSIWTTTNGKVAGIETTYSDGTSAMHGQNEGTPQTLTIASGDSIQSVAVFGVVDVLSVTFVGQLTLTTGSSGTVTGGTKMASNTPSTTTAPPPIIGFGGATDLVLASIYPITVTLLPATWASTAGT